MRRAVKRKVEQAQVLARLQGIERVLIEARRDQHLDELLGDLLRSGLVDFAVERHHAPKGAHQVTREGALICAQSAS